MGAWGEDPMANDTALDWLASQVEGPLAATINATLARYLGGERIPTEAETAAALLVEYASPSSDRYRGIDLRQAASELDLWRVGREAVERLLSDEDWMATWLDADTKRAVLKELLQALEECEAVGR